MAVPKRLPVSTNLPARTLLYPLVPCAVNDVESECLTSYLQRLAWAYQVSVHDLLRLLATRAELRQFQLQFSRPTAPYGQSGAMRLNRLEPATVPWIEALHYATGYPNLAHLTLSRWVGNVSQRRVLRKRVAWCPSCYDEWQDHGQTIYQPLLWMVDVVTMCVRHRCHLIARCGNPACGRVQPVLQSHVLAPGTCKWCGTWLGKHISSDVCDQHEVQWNQWLYEVLSELTVLQPESQQWDHARYMLLDMLERLGGMKTLSKRLKLYDVSWYVRLQRTWADPSLTSLLHLMYLLGCTPGELMEDPQHAEAAPPIVPGSGASETRVRGKRGKNRAFYEQLHERVGRFLQACLQGQQTWISLQHMARRYGLGKSTIMKWYPQETAKLLNQWKVLRMQRMEERILLIQQKTSGVLGTMQTMASEDRKQPFVHASIRVIEEDPQKQMSLTPISGRYTDASLLILLSLSEGEKYMHAMLEDIHRFAGVELEPSAMYRALHRLEHFGCVVPHSPLEQRRLYTLTDLGRETLREKLLLLQQLLTVGTTREAMSCAQSDRPEAML